jgi:hypothetical protein
MIEKQEPRDQRQPSPDAGKDKKPYRKPAFRHERVFETLALSCGKIISTVGQCQFSKKTS